MTERNPTVVITSDESMSEVISRVRGAASGGRTVDLVIPVDSALLLTAREFRAFRDATEDSRLSVVLRTADPLRMQLAEQMGLHVQSLPKPRAVRPTQPAVSPKPEPKPEPETEYVGPDPSTHWPVQSNGATLEPLSADADELPDIPEPRATGVPVRRWLPVAILLAALVAGAFMAMQFLVPRAVVRIVPKSAPVAATLIFDATQAGQALDADAAFALPMQTHQIDAVWNGSAPATGVRTIGDATATGPIELRNAGAEAQAVAAGTRVSTDSGVAFAFVEAVTVPAADAATGEPGEATGRVEAVDPGTSGNVDAGDIGGQLPGGIYYSNRMEPTAGGTDKEFPVVTQADLDKLAAEAAAAAASLANEALAADADASGQIVAEARVAKQDNVFDQPLDAEASSVALQATLTIDVTTYDGELAAAEYERMLTEQLSALAPAGFAVVPKQIDFSGPRELSADEQGVRLEVDASVDAVAQMTTDAEKALAEKLTGTSQAEAEKILAQESAIASYAIDISPSWGSRQMPTTASRIVFEETP